MSLLSGLLWSMRPKQWTKNLLVFAPLIFSGELTEFHAVTQALLTFVAFCLVSGSVYLVNDVIDVERDRIHAKKCKRPIARGDVPIPVALATALVAAVVGVAITWLVGWQVAALTVGFLTLQAGYSIRLKHEPLLDVFAIAAGFLIRAAAGSYAVSTALSPWIYSAVSLLALFLALGKRRHEVLTLEAEAAAHRPVLKHYSSQLLDSLLGTVTAATIVTYAIYSFTSETAMQARGLIFTVPFVAYGLFRYQYLVYQENLGGNPEEILLTDVPLIVTILLWLAVSVTVLYVL